MAERGDVERERASKIRHREQLVEIASLPVGPARAPTFS